MKRCADELERDHMETLWRYVARGWKDCSQEGDLCTWAVSLDHWLWSTRKEKGFTLNKTGKNWKKNQCSNRRKKGFPPLKVGQVGQIKCKLEKSPTAAHTLTGSRREKQKQITESK